MIVGTIGHWPDERKLAHPLLRKAIDYLWQNEFTRWETGKYSIEGDDIFALLMELTTKVHSEQSAEKHERFLDIHYLLEGEETIGWEIHKKEMQPAQPYDQEKDFALYRELADESKLRLSPGMYAVLFPNDIHRPGLYEATSGQIRKVVVKINAALFC